MATRPQRALAGLVVILSLGAAAGERSPRPYAIVGTAQSQCYDQARAIAPPRPGQPFFGQDAQHPGPAPAYALGADGLTVQDLVTGLTWQRSPETNGDGILDSRDKLSFAQAQALPAKLNAARFGGFADWRLPGIKELYSLILFSGGDASGPNLNDATGAVPFLDTRVFRFAYGDPNAGERVIDSQWASSTLSVANRNQMFGVNFADGRIKGYGTSLPGRGEKTFFLLCVRGNPAYGRNDFVDNGDGTVSDRASGLMWARTDSGQGLDWQAALAWVQARNAENYLGHRDWRLPNAKELQSLVDYGRSPATTQSAAIAPVFACTPIRNEAGQPDYGFYWTSTTHVGHGHRGDAAVYLAFGRAGGWPSGALAGSPPGASRPPPAGEARYVDVHGAGAQRSDPKQGDPAAFPRGRGPQGDVVRIANFVRCVRRE